MKTVIILGDGMSDYPVARLGQRTPLQAARKPHMDSIARQGRMGLLTTVPEGMPPGSEVANMSVLGYDVRQCYQGRAVLEAASMGVEIGPDDLALRCNLIAIEHGKILDHSAGHITTEEAAHILQSLDEALGGGHGERPVTFHAGVSYRHLLVLNGWGSSEITCVPPHDHVGGTINSLLPSAMSGAKSGAGQATARRLLELYESARPILETHPVNLARIAEGKRPARAIWLWSPGHKPSMETLTEQYGVKGAMISAVDLLMGLGIYAGMEPIHVPGATGLWDTNYEGKAQACLDALENHDLVYVHVEATDEAGHARDLDLKIRCIEQLDNRLVGPILKGIEEKGLEVVVAVLPDHPTPVETGLHSTNPVPVAIWNPRLSPDETQSYDESEAKQGSLGPLKGNEFIRLALNRKQH